MLCFAWLRVERQVQARWSCRKWFIGPEPWPAATAPWAVILSDLLNRAGLGLFVPSLETSEESLGVANSGINCPQRNEQGEQVGAAGMAPLQGRWKAQRIKKISSMLSVDSERGTNWFLTPTEIWGAEYCGVLWESQCQSLSVKCKADFPEISARYQLVSCFSQL